MSRNKKRRHNNKNYIPAAVYEQSNHHENTHSPAGTYTTQKVKGIYLSTEKKIVIGIIIFTLVLLGGSIFVLSSGNNSAQAINVTQNAKLDVAEKQFDWGTIKYSGPKATKVFTIKNSGTESLQLTKVKTSCTCTTAQISIDGNKSPLFSMHAGSPWVGEVAPGKEAQIEIVFDQTFHGPSGVGPIERYITVETNDANQPSIEFYLKGNVIK